MLLRLRYDKYVQVSDWRYRMTRVIAHERAIFSELATGDLPGSSKQGWHGISGR